MLIKTAFLVHLIVNLSVSKTQVQAKLIGPAYSPERTVELAVFVDQYLYHYWISTIGSSSIRRFIRSYLAVLLQSLNLIYAHPSLEEVPIGFHLTHTRIFWRGDPGNIQRYRDTAPNYHEAFCDFANKENWSGTRWDHALLLTGVDLKFPNGSNYAVAGISWDNSMCNKTYSCSVVEGKTFRSVITAAHEIGHSLGIQHDGLKYNFKCPPRGYIMAYIGEDGGRIAWSRCSKQNLKGFLFASPSVLSNQAACLNNRPTSGKRIWGSRYGRSEIGLLPGERFSLEEQCRLGGRDWYPSRKMNAKKLCVMLYCANVANNQTVPLHPALEGSTCGRNKVCRYGECVPVRRERTTQQQRVLS